FERALKIDPKDQESNRMRKNLAAEVSITRAGLDQADHSRDILRDRDKTKDLEESGRVVRDAEDIKSSLAAIQKDLAESPDDPKLISEVAARYAALKQFDQAIETYDRAYELEPTNYLHREKAGDLRIAGFDRRIQAAIDAGNEDDAEGIKKERLAFQVKEYTARVHDHPTDLVLHFQLGRSLFEMGDLDGAIGEFQQTVRDPRRKVESLTMLGNCFIQKGMYDLAENQLRKALEETPGMSDRKKDILYGLGMLKERQDQVAEALAEFKLIYEVDISFRDVAERMTTLKAKLADS
ncbi:MAG: tetratricopeptide repeat protein, partial [Planctomycetota bacterium]